MSKEYIHKQDAVDAMRKMVIKAYSIEYGAQNFIDSDDACKVLNDLSPADVAPVVRCRSCLHFDSDSHFCFLIKGYMRYDDFCSYGKTR